MSQDFPFDNFLQKDPSSMPFIPSKISKEETKTDGEEISICNLIEETKSASLTSKPPENEDNPVGKRGSDATFTLQLNENQNDAMSKAEGQHISHINPNRDDLLIDRNKTFDNFIVGPSNQLASATAEAVAENPGKGGKFPCLYIHGPSGLGKTHLLHAIANKITERYPKYAVYLTTTRQFMKEMVEAVRHKNLSEFQKKYSEVVDVLMIDDIQELEKKQGTQNEFFHIFNELYNKGKQLIFTSDKNPKDIDGIEERIKTRLQWGLVLDIQKPDFETRIAILKSKAYELDIFLNDEIFTLIANNITSSIRELEGSLIKLSALADLMKVEIDMDMVRTHLKFESTRPKHTIDMHSIAVAVSKFFEIPLTDIKSRARNKELTYARHIAMYLSKKMTNATFKDIAQFYGGRNHSSVIHGVDKIKSNINNNPTLNSHLAQIQDGL